MFVFDYLKGIVQYEIEIENAEEFINEIKNYVSIKNLCIRERCKLEVTCYYNESDCLKQLLRKHNCKVRKEKRIGIPVFINRIKQRSGLAVGCVFAALVVFFSTFFVWDIQVSGNENLSEKEVVEMLNRAGFYEGMIKKKADVKRITDRLLVNEDEVSWMSINFDGTVARVEMNEAKLAKPYPKKENVNLVAKTNGIILRVDALEGGTKVKKGDTVTEGQLLVSAFVDKRTGGSILRGARGFVWANTSHSFCVVVPLEYAKKEYTGIADTGYTFGFLGKKVKFKNPFNKSFSRTEFNKQSGKVKISDSITLPVTFERCDRREFSEYIARRTYADAVDTARNTALERLYESSPGFALADTDEEYVIEDEKLIYKCCFNGVENIAKELEFELS